MANKNATTTATPAAATNRKIVVIQYGWVIVGDITETPATLQVANGSVIRRWGTSHGLGELAISGPTPNTVLDPFGDGEVPRSSVLFTIDCKPGTL